MFVMLGPNSYLNTLFWKIKLPRGVPSLQKGCFIAPIGMDKENLRIRNREREAELE